MEKVLVLDFGGLYSQQVAKRVRENNVYSEIKPSTTPLKEIKEAEYKGIIITGGDTFIGENVTAEEVTDMFGVDAPQIIEDKNVESVPNIESVEYEEMEM